MLVERLGQFVSRLENYHNIVIIHKPFFVMHSSDPLSYIIHANLAFETLPSVPGIFYIHGSPTKLFNYQRRLLPYINYPHEN